MTKGEQVIRIAEGELGVIENPYGSNSGARVRQYQASTDLPGTGWPWCGAFVEWVWTQARVDQAACSPSTAIMASLGRRLGWVGDPVPGAAVVWPGTHTEILVAPAGGGNWHTIGGNVANGVRRKVRSLKGTVVIVPPELRATRPPDRAYYLEDTAAQPRLLGPWRLKASREKAIASLPKAQQARVRRVRHPKGYAFLLGPRRVYGPWTTTDARATAQRVLEQRLGRRLRPYSKPIKN